jgi:hypothetical protein
MKKLLTRFDKFVRLVFCKQDEMMFLFNNDNRDNMLPLGDRRLLIR